MMQSDFRPLEIVIIGGGLGGCLTALMLAGQRHNNGAPKYHITLLEQQHVLLNGASAIASRLHLGGEYPNTEDPFTGRHCLVGALAWKLVMPDNIYSAAPPTSFQISSETEHEGQQSDDPGKLTVRKFRDYYEDLRVEYDAIYDYLKRNLGWSDAKARLELFGSPERGEYFRPMHPDEYGDIPNTAGGFETQERGLNVPKYLMMIEHAVLNTPNITVRTHCKVDKGPYPEAVMGEVGNYTVHCEGGRDIRADMVISAAWQGGPAIQPLDKDIKLKVFRRAMLLVDLPDRWWEDPRMSNMRPVFRMKGEHGGMLSPYNDKVAVCYLPTDDAAYRKGHITLTREEGRLPPNWQELSEPEKHRWTQDYFHALQQRFPSLRFTSNPRLIVRDTLNFQNRLSQRYHTHVEEPTLAPIGFAPRIGIGMGYFQQQRQNQIMDYSVSDAPFHEIKRGMFTLYPTKATYAVMAAMQAAEMIEERAEHMNKPQVKPPTFRSILSRRMLNKYSLNYIGELERLPYYREVQDMFFRNHPDLDPKMMDETWRGRPIQLDPGLYRRKPFTRGQDYGSSRGR